MFCLRDFAREFFCFSDETKRHESAVFYGQILFEIDQNYQAKINVQNFIVHPNCNLPQTKVRATRDTCSRDLSSTRSEDSKQNFKNHIVKYIL